MAELPRWQGSQRRIGLTGGIATGKSSVAQLLATGHGLPVLDADAFAHEALAPGAPAARQVLQRFGPQVRAAGTTAETAVLDRAALARIVFADPAERRWLEALVHPLVRQRMGEELTHLAKEPVVVLMVPLLFEAGLEGLCSEVWLVECDQAQQLERLMARNGLNQDEALARINAQWPLEHKRALADELINNMGSQAELAESVQRALAVSR